ncbi:MAG TPA: acyltransferase [Solirubrobacteraceae bacterium]
MSPARRTDGLDGLRALAALAVLSFHVWLYRDNRPHLLADRSALDHTLLQMNLGLICFFVLSGFLLHRAFARAALAGGPAVDARRYALRRAARIIPAYYVCMAGCLILFALVGYDPITPSAGQLPIFALFAQNYSGATLMQLNPVTWTLSVEAAFYVALPLIGLLVLWLARGGVRAQAAVLVGFIALTLLWRALELRHGWGPIAEKTLPAYMGHFALGMLAALWVEHRRLLARAPLSPARTALLAGAGAILVIALATWHETTLDLVGARDIAANLPAAVGFALIVAAVAGGAGRSVSWLSARPLVFVGVISYGVYLWHLPLLLVAREAGVLPHDLAPRMLTVLALALGAAWLSWVVVERPAMRWAARRPRRAPRAATAPAAQPAAERP